MLIDTCLNFFIFYIFALEKFADVDLLKYLNQTLGFGKNFCVLVMSLILVKKLLPVIVNNQKFLFSKS